MPRTAPGLTGGDRAHTAPARQDNSPGVCREDPQISSDWSAPRAKASLAASAGPMTATAGQRSCSKTERGVVDSSHHAQPGLQPPVSAGSSDMAAWMLVGKTERPVQQRSLGQIADQPPQHLVR